MQKIYVGHNRSIDFQNILYAPIRGSELNSKFQLILPHEKTDEPFNSKEGLKNCKYMIAEISDQSIGLGIEIGWANLYGVEVIFIYQSGSKISNSLKAVSETFIEYNSNEELIQKLSDVLI